MPTNLLELKQQVCEANLELVRQGLVVFTWGNVSGVDRDTGIMVIKPSGVSYDAMKPEQMVVVRLDDGAIVEGGYRPSSDTPTHLALYRAFGAIGGVAHTHSIHATAWAQTRRDLPCYGTTHADHFYGAVPATAPLSREEIESGYERNTGLAIARRFARDGIDPAAMPAVLVASHGPFTWGATPAEAVVNGRVLEECARMAFLMATVAPEQLPIDRALLDKHFLRKHGSDATYGQGKQ